MINIRDSVYAIAGQASLSQFEAVLFDAGDTLIRLSGSGETLLHRAAASLGVDQLDPEDVALGGRR
jgi:hypothetical protein